MVKQYYVDNGQIGGVVSTFMGSLFILSPINFLMLLSLTFSKYQNDPNLPFYFVGALIFGLSWEWFYFAIYVPSQITFGNSQGYKHKNPVMDRTIEIDRKLDILLKRKYYRRR